MHQTLALFRFALCLPLCFAAFACDGSSSNGSTPNEMSQSQVSANSPNEGSAKVDIVINHSPRVTSMQSSAGPVESGAIVSLQVAANDPDGDALTYAWTSSCPGAFDRTDGAQVTFTTGDLGTAVACSFAVSVNDGHGGTGKGNLVLTAVVPKINVAPQMGIVYQSTGDAVAGEVVILHAMATDPEGEALTWTWKAASDDGAFSNQVDEVGASDVHWTAPATPGSHEITATATDPEGASASFVFTVKVAG